jgi:hypothetical protein
MPLWAFDRRFQIQRWDAGVVLLSRRCIPTARRGSTSDRESLERTVDGLRRKLEQGTQQAQDEAFEPEPESILRGKFPLDRTEPVSKGATGGDIVHTVNGQIGRPAGVILWELKNPRNWPGGLASRTTDLRLKRGSIGQGILWKYEMAAK